VANRDKDLDKAQFDAYIWNNSSKRRASALVIHTSGKMKIAGKMQPVKPGDIYLIPAKKTVQRNRRTKRLRFKGKLLIAIVIGAIILLSI